jgi:hypothetical protein
MLYHGCWARENAGPQQETVESLGLGELDRAVKCYALIVILAVGQVLYGLINLFAYSVGLKVFRQYPITYILEEGNIAL